LPSYLFLIGLSLGLHPLYDGYQMFRVWHDYLSHGSNLRMHNSVQSHNSI
jgi:hypothetical protein